MIECEICGIPFHADDINECPHCGIELCPKCYEEHIIKCISETFDFDEYECEENSLIPHECPKCEEELQLDVNPDGSASVYCTKCDFWEDLNEEQLAELSKYSGEDCS